MAPFRLDVSELPRISVCALGREQLGVNTMFVIPVMQAKNNNQDRMFARTERELRSYVTQTVICVPHDIHYILSLTIQYRGIT